jgi:hypothetical protein
LIQQRVFNREDFGESLGGEFARQPGEMFAEDRRGATDSKLTGKVLACGESFEAGSADGCASGLMLDDDEDTAHRTLNSV